MAATKQDAEPNASKQEAEIPQQDDYDWTFDHGRRYASSKLGKYWMPNDEPEIKRLNQQHWMFTETKGGSMCNAPLPKSPKILDLGCGSGIWCMEMAEEHPGSSVTGADVSPIQPKNKPSNIEWVLLDLEADWPFPENHFDLIHLLLVHGCVADWSKTLAKILKYLRPGGYIEHQELAMGTQYAVDGEGKPLDRSIYENSDMTRWARLMVEASDNRGRPLHLGPNLKAWQEAAGFEDVHETVYAMPVGTWPEDPKQKAVGTAWLNNVLSGLDGFTMNTFTKVLGWTEEDTKKFIEACKDDLRRNAYRRMVDVHVVYGRRPLTG